jgi:hypothetical protein
VLLLLVVVAALGGILLLLPAGCASCGDILLAFCPCLAVGHGPVVGIGCGWCW